MGSHGAAGRPMPKCRATARTFLLRMTRALKQYSLRINRKIRRSRRLEYRFIPSAHLQKCRYDVVAITCCRLGSITETGSQYFNGRAATFLLCPNNSLATPASSRIRRGIGRSYSSRGTLQGRISSEFAILCIEAYSQYPIEGTARCRKPTLVRKYRMPAPAEPHVAMPTPPLLLARSHAPPP